MFLAGAAPTDRPVRTIPSLSKAVEIDGNVKRLTPAVELKAGGEGQLHANFTARVAYWKDSLLVGVDISDANLLPGAILGVEMFFPAAGATARGYAYRFGIDGKRASDPNAGPPAFANKAIESKMRRTLRGWVVEASLPAKSFPRFPAKGELLFELCLSYEHRVQDGAPAAVVSNCEGGSMHGQVLALPDAFRRSLGIAPPSDAVALEGRERGWVGFNRVHQPIWMAADRLMTPELLRTFFLEGLQEPGQLRISVPSRMRLLDGRRLATFVRGRDPFAESGRCDPEDEMKMEIYVLDGRSARRALEWPAASCKVGRASSVVLEDDGVLSIGFASGATVNFVWSDDHFERTEIG